MNTKQKGFTLFELLVSISIIAILIAVTTISFGAAQRKARDAKRQQDLGMIQKAAEQYYALSGTYTYPNDTGAPASWTAAGNTVLEVFPSDPKSGWTPYSYSVTATGGYCSCAEMENSAQANSDNNCDFSAGTKGYYCVKNQQ